jgi:organic hydroperoxide reductase OsmC/OhrA
LSFKSKIGIDIERLESGDLTIRFNNENIKDLVIKKEMKKGGEARQLLAASLAECMCSTLIFLLDWKKIDVKKFHTKAEVVTQKDDQDRICVDSINLEIQIDTPKDDQTIRKLKRVKNLFKRGCLISRSLEKGVKVNYSITT